MSDRAIAALGRMGPFTGGEAAEVRALIERHPELATVFGERLLRGADPQEVFSLVVDTVYGHGEADLEALSTRESSLAISAISDALINELAARPERLREMSPRFFEELMAELYVRQGFDVELTPKGRDGGVDLYLVKHESFGRLLTIVDCKHYAPNRPVEVSLVRHLLGVVEVQKASAGVIATTSPFTTGARELQGKYPFRLGLQDYLDVRSMLLDALTWRTT